MGGTENFIAALTAATARDGVESCVLVSSRHADEEGPRPQVETTRLDIIGPDAFPIARAGLRTLASLVRRADVVHVHDLRFMLESVTAIAARTSKPLVLSTHGLIFHTARLRRAKALAWRSYYSRLLARFAAIACSSERDLDYCRLAGLTNARLIQNPVEVEPFLAVERRPARSGALLSFGRLAPNKGLERLALVLEAMPKCSLTVIGSGDARYVEELQARFDPRRVRFMGAVSRGELVAQLATHDCFVLPSRQEGFGLSLVEAMAAGIPVVASDIAPFREIAVGTSVRLVDFDDPTAASEAVRRALESSPSEATREHAASFSWAARGREFTRLYDEVRR